MVQKTMCLSDLCTFMKEIYHAIVSLRYVQGIRSAVSPERWLFRAEYRIGLIFDIRRNIVKLTLKYITLSAWNIDSVFFCLTNKCLK